MRIRKTFTRPEGKKSARLIVIASEGKDTESIYFDAVKENLCASNVHMEVLRRDSGNSSPEHVHRQLNDFMKEYSIEDDDELWMVIDRDRWPEAMLSRVAQLCSQNEQLHFCLSNPCFELWLLLHLEDVESFSEEEKRLLAENRKPGKSGDTWLKRRVRSAMGIYHESNYDTGLLIPLIPTAMERAICLDTNPADRWPQSIGTRVYRLINSITDRNM